MAKGSSFPELVSVAELGRALAGDGPAGGQCGGHRAVALVGSRVSSSPWVGFQGGFDGGEALESVPRAGRRQIISPAFTGTIKMRTKPNK